MANHRFRSGKPWLCCSIQAGAAANSGFTLDANGKWLIIPQGGQNTCVVETTPGPCAVDQTQLSGFSTGLQVTPTLTTQQVTTVTIKDVSNPPLSRVETVDAKNPPDSPTPTCSDILHASVIGRRNVTLKWWFIKDTAGHESQRARTQAALDNSTNAINQIYNQQSNVYEASQFGSGTNLVAVTGDYRVRIDMDVGLAPRTIDGMTVQNVPVNFYNIWQAINSPAPEEVFNIISVIHRSPSLIPELTT